MDPNDLVLQYLDEAHATETALVTNLRAHIAMTTDAEYQQLLERHLSETQDQVAAIKARRGELGEKDGRSLVAGAFGLAMDVAGQILVLSKGPLDAVRTNSQQERMLKNARDEAATEALEIALYDALEAAARAAGDGQTAELAVEHRKQEEQMLADLRKQIGRLAVAAFEDKTDTKAKTTASTSRSSSGRSRSTSSSSSSSRRKASGAKPSRPSSPRTSSSRSRSSS
jgi:ferritin-like metal-binding protein YciE